MHYDYEEVIEKVISDFQLNFTNYFQYKFFVESIEAIMRDEEGCQGDGIYKFLGEKAQEDPDTIKKRIKSIKSNLELQALERLGFKKTPKNKDLLLKIASLAKSKVEPDEY